jgi:rhamnogalacturonyl hydrolase YesR
MDKRRISLTASVDAVRQWVESRHYKGYDPGDGLMSFLRPLTFRTIFGERILQQLIWKSPFNLRPYVGIRPMDSTKGRGFMAWGYLLSYRATGRPESLEKAVACLDWLRAHRSPRYADCCWGNHFDFTTRSGRISAHESTIVWSGLIGQAFIEAYATTREARFLESAQSICDWILKLPRERTSTGDCLSYVAGTQSSIHNSNMLGAAMLACTWKHSGRAELLDTARNAMRYSCARQRSNGAWWYGEMPKYHWIDNFHTGYNLDSLKRYIEATGEPELEPCIDRGYQFFVRTFFEPTGRPRYYHDRTYPIDIQCAAQAIDTLCFFSDRDPSALPLAMKVARWTIVNMQDPSGYFYYRRYPWLTARTPYFHWGQATMFKALTHLQGKLDAKLDALPEPVGMTGNHDT